MNNNQLSVNDTVKPISSSDLQGIWIIVATYPHSYKITNIRSDGYEFTLTVRHDEVEPTEETVVRLALEKYLQQAA